MQGLLKEPGTDIWSGGKNSSDFFLLLDAACVLEADAKEKGRLQGSFNVVIKAPLEGVGIDLNVDSFTDQCTPPSRPAGAIQSINLSN